jgi:hypothetical protein
MDTRLNAFKQLKPFLVGSWILTGPAVMATERPSEVLYIDSEKGFLLADPLPNDVRPGDPVCLIQESKGILDCSAKAEDHSGQRLVFLSATSLEKLSTGDRVLLKRIYIKSASEAVSPKTLQSHLVRDQNQDSTQKGVKQSLQARKLPSGGAPDLKQSSPEYATEEFPEIFVPKIKKRRHKATKEADPTLQVTESIRKIFKKDDVPTFNFAQDQAERKQTEADDPPPQLDSVEPTPLALEFSITGFENSPLLPLATFDSLRFRTLRADESSRQDLWVTNKTKLEPQLGYGFQLGINRNRQHYASLGWRSFRFTQLQSTTSFDEIDGRFVTLSRTRASLQAAHAGGGWIWNLTSWLDLSAGLGLDIYESELKFRAETLNNIDSSVSLMAFAQSRFQTIALQGQGSVLASWGSWGLSVATLAAVPVVIRNRSFDGSVNVPERIRFEGDPRENLETSLGHRTAPIAAEIWMGLTYTPKRD